MRALSSSLALALLIMGSLGCGTSQQHGGGGQDMSVAMPANGPDLAPPPFKLTCSAVDNLGDGQACSTMGTCPAPQVAVAFGGSCKCFNECDTSNQGSCPCDRFCDPLTLGDAGSGGACLPGNGGGERCGRDSNGTPFGNGLCRQGLACVSSDSANQFRYCMYLCNGSNNDCPQQTECDILKDNSGHAVGNVCNILHTGAAKALGAACTLGSDTCVLGALCDGTTCKPQCDGPNATCSSGTCTAITDARLNDTVGYVCK